MDECIFVITLTRVNGDQYSLIYNYIDLMEL